MFGVYTYEVTTGATANVDLLSGEKYSLDNNHDRMIVGVGYTGSAAIGDTLLDMSIGSNECVHNQPVVDVGVHSPRYPDVTPVNIPVPKGQAIRAEVSVAPTTNSAFIMLKIVPAFRMPKARNVGLWWEDVTTAQGATVNVLEGCEWKTEMYDRIIQGVGYCGSAAVHDCAVNIHVGGESVVEDLQNSIVGAGCTTDDMFPCNILVRGGKAPDLIRANPTVAPTTNSAYLVLNIRGK